MLKTQVSRLEANKVALSVEVETEKVNAAYANFFAHASHSVKIPGFRPGKAPKAVLAKFLGSDAVKEQVEEALLEEAYPQAIKETKLQPVSSFDIEESNLCEGKPYTFKAVFEVRPTLGEFTYKGLTVQVQREIIDDSSVEKVLNQIREQHGSVEQVENAVLQVGDLFTANIEVFSEGVKDTDLSNEKAVHKMIEGDKLFTPCLGMKTGETREYEIKNDSEEDKNSKYYGKTLTYKVSLKAVSRPKLPELTDEFVKSLGNFEGLAALKEDILKDLTERARVDAEERAYDDMITQILNECSFDVPEAMIQNTIDYYIEGLDRRWRQFGTTIQDFLRNSGKDIDEFRETFRDRAVRYTKTTLVTQTIGEREHIESTEAEYREEIEKRAKESNMPVEKLLSALADSDGEASVKLSLKINKIHEFMLKNNQVNYDMVKDVELNKGEAE